MLPSWPPFHPGEQRSALALLKLGGWGTRTVLRRLPLQPRDSSHLA